VPFDERLGVILNSRGRVLDPETQDAVPGMYVTGWIKRGPSGVIGTNKPCAAETVANMLEDFAAGRTLGAVGADCDAKSLLRDRQARVVSFADWLRLDQTEVERGAATGRPRVKFTSVGEMLAHLDEGKRIA
jgi:ferredoxin--NADP+ reductase